MPLQTLSLSGAATHSNLTILIDVPGLLGVFKEITPDVDFFGFLPDLHEPGA